jgi:hypothetical protein
MVDAQARGWVLVALDLGIDLSTSAGEFMADRDSGMTLSGIADVLNAEQVPPARGGARWYASTVQAVLRSQAAAGVP